jgi:hypothetical protein
MGKRGGTPAKTPIAKKEKISPDIMVIQDALKQVSHLPESCSSMLAAVAPESLGIAKDNRDEDQAVVVQWIEGVLEKRQAELTRNAEAALEKVRELEASKLQLQADVQKAEAALAESTTAMPTTKIALAESTIAMTATKKMLAERQEEQRLGDADHVLKKKDFEDFEKVFVDDFKAPLAAGDALDHEKLQPYVASLDLEEGLMSSIASSCGKPKDQRSKFQAAVLEELENAFLAHREKLQGLAQVGKPAAEERAAAVQKAEDELTKQRKVQEEAKAALAEAQRNVEMRSEELKAARQAVTEVELQLVDVSRVCQESKSIQEEFEAGPLTTFRTCRDTVGASQCATAGA